MSKASFHWEDPFLLDQQLTEEERMVRDAAAVYAQEKLTPRVLEAFRNERTDPSIFREMGELGMLGATIPPEYGGAGLNYVSYGLIAREIERVDSGFRSMMSVQSSLVMLPINEFGTEEQKQKYVPKLASGEWFGSYCLTEPGAGSDANSGKTKAVLTADGKHYLISGQKMWISNAGFCNVMIVFARIEDDKNIRFGLEGVKGLGEAVLKKLENFKPQNCNKTLPFVEAPKQETVKPFSLQSVKNFRRSTFVSWTRKTNCLNGTRESKPS
jgi:glutaryl-CoA dehydrogenase